MKHTSDLRAAAAARGVLLVAHRGVWGGNVPPNTIAAYDTALAQGADMLEIDLNRTADGKLVILHPCMERQMLGWNGRITADMPFLAIVRGERELRAIRRRKLRHVGVEALFSDMESPFATREWVERQHRAGQVVWANAIIYDYKVQLVAGRSDDMATAGGDPEHSWGWLADLGYDLVQTDWLLACSLFLERTGRRTS